MNLPKKVEITEVGPRDGLQNEKKPVATETKVQFIQQLVQAGCSQIEVSSFVSPKWVPQLADAAEVSASLPQEPSFRAIVLIPNLKGLHRAIESGLKSVAIFTAASEAFTKKNINQSIRQSLENFRSMMPLVQQHQLWVRGYISTAFACPYQGDVSPQAVLEVAQALLEMGVHELSIGDTIGAAIPTQVETLLTLMLKEIPVDRIALHFHDTRGTALANALVGLQMGIYKFDSSAGGLGGCPYAPGASGNLATEDLVYMLEKMGIATGIQLESLVKTSQWMSQQLHRPLPSRYLQACTAQK